MNGYFNSSHMRNSSAVNLTNFIEVERKFTRNRTIETRLKEGCPVFAKNVLSARVVLESGVHRGRESSKVKY